MRLVFRESLYSLHRRLDLMLSSSKELEKAIGRDSRTVLDVGCGRNSPVKLLPRTFFSVGVDLYRPDIEISKAQGVHDQYFNADCRRLCFQSGSFDCVAVLSLIEHLWKEEGSTLLNSIEEISRKKVIVITPGGFTPLHAYDNNPWQTHKSGWTAEEMKRRGYKVIGISGLKALRNDRGEIRFRPKRLWAWISTLTQFLVRNHPEFAFELLCTKDRSKYVPNDKPAHSMSTSTMSSSLVKTKACGCSFIARASNPRRFCSLCLCDCASLVDHPRCLERARCIRLGTQLCERLLPIVQG